MPVFFLVAGLAALGFGFLYHNQSPGISTLLFLIGGIFVAIGIVSIIVIPFVLKN
jgi:hypothetical protein